LRDGASAPRARDARRGRPHADPLRDIRNATRISTVGGGGRVLEGPTLDASIARARELLNP
jgi:hypothetical protein